MKRLVPRIAFVVPLVALVVMSALVAADPHGKKAGETAYAEGQARFKAGDYEGAAERFTAAYEADPDPVYLYNIAQAYRLAKQCVDARDYYQKFLAAAPQAPNRDKVERYVAELEPCAKAQKPPDPKPKPVDPPPPDPKLALKPGATPGGAVKPGDPPIDTHAGLARPSDPGRARRFVGIAGIAVGAASLGVGIYFYTDVRGAERDRAGLCPAPCTWNDQLAAREAELQHRGDRSSTLSIVSFAVAGVAIAGGIALYVTGRRHPVEHVAIVPTSGGAFASAGWSF